MDKLTKIVITIKYGLTVEQYKKILRKQHYCCAICDRKFTNTNKPCCDHNHKTMNFRGLLCIRCNTTVGALEKDFNKFMKYLRK